MSLSPKADDSALPPLPPRPPGGHKGTFGRVLIVAGSTGMTGAAALAGEAALRTGSGLVYLAVPASVNPIVELLCRETVSFPVAEDPPGSLGAGAVGEILELAGGCDAVCVGPGLGQATGTGEAVRALIEGIEAPLVLDADGLNLLSDSARHLRSRPGPTAITPHPGEMARLTGRLVGTGEVERIGAATDLSAELGVVVVLKGHGTVIAEGPRYTINPTGNSGMATAGSGDVLAGMIASLLGQGMGIFGAARLGVYLHGQAGDRTAGELGEHSLIAGDLLHYIPQAFLSYSRR